MSTQKQKNCIRTSEKFWLLNFGDLFTHYTLIPTDESSSIGSKLNSMIRLSLIIFFILLFYNYKYSYIYILIIFITNLILYKIYEPEY